MEKYNVKFKKRFGQNFLKDKNIIKRIVNVVSVETNSLVLEVGVGGGILTRELAFNFDNVLAFEIDESLKEEQSKRLEGFNNIKIIYDDFLKCDLKKGVSKYKYNNLYFISNVPYYITTPILLKLIDSDLSFKKIVMMVQKEVGERFSAKEGSKEYGAITVILNYFFNIKKEFVVGKNNFVPVPNVDSIIISLTPRDIKEKVEDFNFFKELVNNSFQFKRKTLKNNLYKYNLTIVDSVLNKYNFSLNDRAEKIPLEVFVSLANSLSNKKY